MWVGKTQDFGWGYQADTLYGGLDCELLPFFDGAIFAFDFNFVRKTLLIRCGAKSVESKPLPRYNDGDRLFPAFSLGCSGEKVEFVPYPYQ